MRALLDTLDEFTNLKHRTTVNTLNFETSAPMVSDSLFGKTILITGASRGIGAATASACLAGGATIIPHATKTSDAATSVSAELQTDFLFEDLAIAGAGQRLFDAAVARAGRIDAVVNNAGVYLPSPLVEAEGAKVMDRAASSGDQWSAGWARTMAVNVQAPADICRAAIAHFRSAAANLVGAAAPAQSPQGIVVNIASRAGHRGDGLDHAAYAASKGALLAMTKTFARALAGERIRFYAIAPGWVETRMAPEDIEKRRLAVADIPLGSVAQPGEIAALVAFLITDQCPSAVGATFDANGASYVR